MKRCMLQVARTGSGLVAFLALLVAGCGGGEFASKLSVSPRPRVFKEPEQTSVRLPQDQKFNIHLHEASNQAGLNGQVQADADARAEGSAEAHAAVTNGGAAQAVFQLGHALSNDTDRQMDFDFRVRFDYEFEALAGGAEQTADASVRLQLYARRARGMLLRNVPLITYTTENGAAKRRSAQDMDFTVTLGPGDSVEVFLAGQTLVQVPDGRSASCRLKLTNLQYEITARPAPAVKTAAHVRP